MRHTRLLCAALALIFVLSVFPAALSEDVGELKIKLFKVGKGDCFLFRTENHAVLIDAAEEDDAGKICDYLDEKDVARIDYMIVSHFDKDHIGAAADVLLHVQVDNILQPGYEKDSTAYRRYSQALKREPVTVTEEMSFTLDGVTFTITPAPSDSYLEDEDDDFSLVVSVKHGENTFLFPGDVRSERIAEMLASGADLAHTFLKVPDHGLFEKNSADLFAAVAPEYAVITCSDKNPAAQETLDALDALGTRVYQTRYGSIALTSDGYAIIFKQ